MGDAQVTAVADSVRCPHCSGEIKAAARLCKHCKRGLGGQAASKPLRERARQWLLRVLQPTPLPKVLLIVGWSLLASRLLPVGVSAGDLTWTWEEFGSQPMAMLFPFLVGGVFLYLGKRGAPSPWTSVALLGAGLLPGLADALELLRRDSSIFSLVGCLHGLAWSFCVATCAWIFVAGRTPREEITRQLVLIAAVVIVCYWLLPARHLGGYGPRFPQLLTRLELFIFANGDGAFNYTLTQRLLNAFGVVSMFGQFAVIPLAVLLRQRRPLPAQLLMVVLAIAPLELLADRSPANFLSASIFWFWLEALVRFSVVTVQYVSFVIGWGMLSEMGRSAAPVPPSDPRATATAGSAEARLSELEQLRARGLITQAEYAAFRAEILAKL